MYKIIKYIDDHLHERISIEDAAALCGYSKWYFCSLFRQFTGMSFTTYVNDKKMQYAAIDILRGERLSKIAAKYGYDTFSGFNKAFLKKYGCYPTEFKKMDTAFHVQYKERIDSMFHLSDRCATLREDAVNKKSQNQDTAYIHKVLSRLGHLSQKQGSDTTALITAGLVYTIENAPARIADGELIVGYHFGDCSSADSLDGTDFPLEDTPAYRQTLAKSGLSAEKVDTFFRNPITFHQPVPPVAYSACDQNMHDEWAAIGRCIAASHNILDYQSVLELGFEGLLKKVEYWESQNGSRPLYDAAKKICRVACSMGEKYAAEALRQQNTPNISPKRLEELQQIYHSCMRVPRHPAQTLLEAAQSLWFAHILTCWEDSSVNANSLGRLDQILYPYYQKDIASGRLTKEEAFEIICCLWIKLYRDYDVQQSCVGGCTVTGEDAVNELSYLMLDATEQLDFIRCLSVRYSKNTDPKFMRRALEVVGHLQKGVPFFFNDDVMIPALVNAGIALEDARNYSQIGCVETAIIGKSNPHAVTGETNLLKALEYALNDGKSMISDTVIEGVRCLPTRKLTTYETLKQAVFRHIENILRVTCEKVVAHTDSAVVAFPRPYKSLLTQGCLERGLDFNNHGALYDYYQIMLGGIPNLADSLAALQKFVYIQKKYTLEQIVYQLRNDFPDELIRLDLLNNAPKFGNDTDEVDDIAVEITNFACDCLERLSQQLHYAFHAQPFTYLWLIDHGRTTAATPDGRHKGENIAYSVSPMQGRDFSGLTAVFNSICKFPTTRTPGTTSAIIEVDPHLFTDRNLDNFTQMMLVLAEKGISNVQFNITDAQTLIDAKKHPEKHQNLAVRVSGYSQKFHLLNDSLQDHIIERTKHKCL